MTVDACTTKRMVHCPDHAWVCELDGELRSTTSRVSIWRIRGFRRSRPRVVGARSVESESIEGGKEPPAGVVDGLARGPPRRGHGLLDVPSVRNILLPSTRAAALDSVIR